MDETSVIGSASSSNSHDDSLFSLLLQAIHAYQEKFESKQNQLFESSYQARVMTILHKYHSLDINEICQMIQVPKIDTGRILDELKTKGLVSFGTDPGQQEDKVKLTEEGQRLSDELVALAKQHDRDIYALFGKCDANSFRDNLTRIIDWASN